MNEKLETTPLPLCKWSECQWLRPLATDSLWNGSICTNLIQFVYMGFCSMTALIVELMPPMHVDAGMNIRIRIRISLYRSDFLYPHWVQKCRSKGYSPMSTPSTIWTFRWILSLRYALKCLPIPRATWSSRYSRHYSTSPQTNLSFSLIFLHFWHNNS